MALKKRLLRVTLDMPDGQQVLTEALMLNIHIKKGALALQNTATIEVGGLTARLREHLLSNFSAFNKRLRESGQLAADYINVKIEAGYSVDGAEALYQVFVGQIVLCELTQAPPDIVIRITAYTRQINRTQFVTSRAPSPIRFDDFCRWAAQQMGLGTNVIVETSINAQVLENPGRTAYVVAALLPEIQNYQRDTIAAYIDDDTLIVKDKNKILDRDSIVNIKEFIGTPMWNEWGADFTCWFDSGVRLAQGIRMSSILNQSLNSTLFIVMELQYELTSRENQFLIKASCSPAAE